MTEQTAEASGEASGEVTGPPAAPRAAHRGSTRRNSVLVASGILLSRIAGFAREAAIANFLGVGLAVDAFKTALRIPNLMQNLLGEGVLSASFIPVYSRLLAEGREEEAGRVAGAIAGLLSLVAAGLVVVGVVFAGPLTTALAPGFTGERFELTVTLMRVLTPGVGLLVLSAWALGVLNSHRRFFLSYVAPVLWNAAQIGALVGFGLAGFADRPLAVALAWGVLVGGALQFLVQLPGVLRLARGLRLSVDTGLAGVRRTISAFWPIVGARGVVQLLIYVDLLLASLLVTGAVSALGFAQTLFVLPISLFGMSVAAAELPELSRPDVVEEAAVSRRLDDGLARIAFYVVPSAVGFLALGDLIVATLYQRGEFDAVDTRLVWVVLAGFTVGLLANTSSRLLQSAFYGGGDPRTPAVAAAVRVVVAALVGGLLMLQLDRVAIVPGGFALVGDLPAFTPLPEAVRQGADRLRLGAAGLAVASGASAWIEYRILRRRLALRLGRRIRAGGGELTRVVVAAGAAALVALAARALVADAPTLVAGPVAVALTGAAYLVAAYWLRLPEAVHLVTSVRRRLP